MSHVPSSAQILVVEDEADLRDLLVLQLQREGYRVFSCEKGEDAFVFLKDHSVDLVLLDWMLPGMSGVDLARALRSSHPDLPILILTARAEAADIVLGLEAGADDYITKPYETPILRARIRALLRRSVLVKSDAKDRGVSSPNLSSQPSRLGLRLDEKRHEAYCGPDLLALTLSEFRLLQALLENRGKVLTRNQLIQAVQGLGVTVIDRAIDTHVFGLRKKLGACAEWIETVRGVGYRIQDQPSQE